MKLTHRQIEVFRAVMATGHVTRAAEQLHSSQPTVSREIARLEQVLGLLLFDRVKGRLRPTVRALALMEEVELSYVGLARISATAQQLRRFAQAQPEAGVTITPMESPALELALSDQRFDLGLSERREAPVGCSLHSLLVADEVAVLPPGHGLAALPRLAPADFEGQAFISLAAADPYRQQIDARLAQAGVARRLLIESPSAASVCALVRQGLGLAIVNPLTALALADTGLLIRPLDFSIPFHVAAVLPQWRAEHPLRAGLLAALQAAAAELLARLGTPR